MANPHNLPLPDKFKTLIDGVKRLDDRGLIYYLDYDQNYYELESYISMLVKPGCSTFTGKNKTEQAFMARNYDYTHYRNNDDSNKNDVTGLAVVVRGNNPQAKYKSIGVADGFWMDQSNGTVYEGCLDDGKTDISALSFAPFVCMDAMNEKGLAVSIMYLSTKLEWNEVEYRDPESLNEKEKKHLVLLDKAGQLPDEFEKEAKNKSFCINTVDKKMWQANKEFSCHQNEPGKKEVYHPVLMRLMIDNCASVDEALYLAQSVNVVSPTPDGDYHILVTDRTGKSVILEWVENKLNIMETNHATNYFLTKEDKFGYGIERDNVIVASLARFKNGMLEKDAIKVLELVAQDLRIHGKEGFTQWSSYYNLAENTLKLSIFMNYDKQYEFKI